MAGSCRMERWSSARQKNRVSDWGNKQNLDRSKNPHACGWGSRLRDELKVPGKTLDCIVLQRITRLGGKIIMGIQRITLQGCASWGWRQRPRYSSNSSMDNKRLWRTTYTIFFTYSLLNVSLLWANRQWAWKLDSWWKNRIVFFFFSCKLIYCLRRSRSLSRLFSIVINIYNCFQGNLLKMKWGHT